MVQQHDAGAIRARQCPQVVDKRVQNMLQLQRRRGGGNNLVDRGHLPVALGLHLAGLAVLASRERLAQLALNRWDQAAQGALEQVVVRARSHHGHSGFLADGAGNHDERDVEAAFLVDSQSRGRIESRHAVVAKNQIPRPIGQGLPHGFGGIHPAVLDREFCPRQMADQQVGVAWHVLDQEDAQGFLRRLCHGSRRFKPRAAAR